MRPEVSVLQSTAHAGTQHEAGGIFRSRPRFTSYGLIINICRRSRCRRVLERVARHLRRIHPAARDDSFLDRGARRVERDPALDVGLLARAPYDGLLRSPLETRRPLSVAQPRELGLSPVSEFLARAPRRSRLLRPRPFREGSMRTG